MQQRSEETKNHILQAASHLFAKNGYDATGVAEICTAAGASKGAFYHHFPSKQAVFLTLLEDWLAMLDQQMARLLAGSRSVSEGLLRLTGLIGMVFDSASGSLPMFLEFWRESSHDPQVWQATIAPYRRYQQLLAGVVRRGVEDGSLRQVNPDAAARIFEALALGLILQGVIDPEGANWNEVSQQGMQLLMEGLKNG